MPDGKLDISDLDKAAVLAALFNGARIQGLGFLKSSDEGMTIEAAQAILDSGQTHFDYLQGRVMKVDLSGDSFDPYLYDRDNGEGAAFSVIRELRTTNDPNGANTQRLHEFGTANAATLLQEVSGDEAIETAKRASARYAR